MKEFFRDYDDSIQYKPPLRQDMPDKPGKRQKFTPIEEVPDHRPGPDEILMEKEEPIKEKPAEIEKGKNKFEERDLSRPVSYSEDQGNEYARTFEQDNRQDETPVNREEEIAEKVDKGLLKETRPNHYTVRQRPAKKGPDGKFRVIDSHGERGRKPAYKDRRVKALS